MREARTNALHRLGDQCVTVAAVVISRFRRKESSDSVAARLRELPQRERVAVVGGTLAALFVVALLAAQGGLLGMAALFAVVVVMVG